MGFYVIVALTVLNHIAYKGSAFGLGPAFWMDALLLGGGALIMKADARQRAQSPPGRAG